MWTVIKQCEQWEGNLKGWESKEKNMINNAKGRDKLVQKEKTS